MNEEVMIPKSYHDKVCEEIIRFKDKQLYDAVHLLDDGTLEIHVTDYKMVKRVLVEDDNNFGNLFYEDADRPQEWIPCSERLPNEGEVVLVCMRIESHKAEWEEQRSIEFGRISSDRYDFNGTGWEWLNESGADYWQADWNNSILAWMPLPKPWKGADDERRLNKEV